jgi:hypothetical protein
MDIITDELRIRKDLRDPIISEYIKQLGLKVASKKYRLTSINRMSLQKKKKILDAARKAIMKLKKSTFERILSTSVPDFGGTRMLPILID